MAEHTALLVVDPDKREDRHGELPGSDAALYLARHGGNIQTRTENSYGRRVDEVVLSIAQKEAADRIVMGAYSKPRPRQLLFGGVTRSMLSGVRYPPLLSRCGLPRTNPPGPLSIRRGPRLPKHLYSCRPAGAGLSGWGSFCSCWACSRSDTFSRPLWPVSSSLACSWPLPA